MGKKKTAGRDVYTWNGLEEFGWYYFYFYFFGIGIGAPFHFFQQLPDLF